MAWVHRLQGLLGGKHVPCKIVIMGLPNSGKSTIMVQLKPPEARIIKTILPVDYSAEEFQSVALSFVAFDVGREQQGFGNPWEDCYKDCNAVIVVVDSTDRYNMTQLAEQLVRLYDKIETRDIPVLFLANKSDQSGSLPQLQLREMLQLDSQFKNKTWTMQNTDALTGDGLHEGLDWLAHKLRTKCRKDLSGPLLKC